MVQWFGGPLLLLQLWFLGPHPAWQPPTALAKGQSWGRQYYGAPGQGATIRRSGCHPCKFSVRAAQFLLQLVLPPLLLLTLLRLALLLLTLLLLLLLTLLQNAVSPPTPAPTPPCDQNVPWSLLGARLHEFAQRTANE